jgi:hypothetical protein
MQFLFGGKVLILARSCFTLLLKIKSNIMKKIVMAVGLMLACAGVGFAQTKPVKKEAAKKDTAAAHDHKAKIKTQPQAAYDHKAVVTKPQAAYDNKAKQPVAKANPQAATAAPVKKDGTPDMRYKANKAAADTVVHKKKDGTPDKRFKENKKG